MCTHNPVYFGDHHARLKCTAADDVDLKENWGDEEDEDDSDNDDMFFLVPAGSVWAHPRVDKPNS